MTTKILIVDNEPGVAKTIARAIGRGGHETQVTHSYDEAVAFLEATDTPYHLAVIDYSMPGLDGIDLSRYIRQHYPHMGTILISGVPDADMACKGFGSADRFVAKKDGFHPMLAVIDEVLRMVANRPIPTSQTTQTTTTSSTAAPADPAPPLVSGPLTLDLAQHKFSFGTRPLYLTPSELIVLTHLVRHPYQPITKQQLSEVLESRLGHIITADGIPVLIHAIRLKIEPDLSSPRYLITKRGVGYYWDSFG